jgi:hypothetical protein
VDASCEFFGGGRTKQVEGEVYTGTLAAHVVLEVGVEAFVTAVEFGGKCDRNYIYIKGR